MPEFDCSGRSREIPIVRLVGGVDEENRVVENVDVGKSSLS